MSKAQSAFFLPIVAVGVAFAAFLIYEGVTEKFEGIDLERSVKEMKSLGSQSEGYSRALEILLKHPKEARALDYAMRFSRPPGAELQLLKLKSIFDPPANVERPLFTRIDNWRLLEARYRLAAGHWERAATLFEERWAQKSLQSGDLPRFISALIKIKKSEKAWKIALIQGKERPDLMLTILDQLKAEESPFVRPLACELALSCFSHRAPSVQACKLIHALKMDQVQLASLLMGTTLSKIDSKELKELRVEVHKVMAKMWTEKLIALRKSRGHLVPQDLTPDLLNPWGRPYKMDRRCEFMVTVAGLSGKLEKWSLIEVKKAKIAPKTVQKVKKTDSKPTTAVEKGPSQPKSP
jgi:hypothetical protein